MTAYLVNEIEVTDPVLYQKYASQVLPTLTPFGGRFLVRGGAVEAVDGEPPSRVVVVEFPDRAAAKAWRESPAYQALLRIREQASTSRVYVVDGFDG